MLIQSINPQNDGLNIVWDDGSSSCFPWLWIRDHSESIVDLHPDSKQRQIDAVSYTHLRAHETDSYLVCRLLLEKNRAGEEK